MARTPDSRKAQISKEERERERKKKKKSSDEISWSISNSAIRTDYFKTRYSHDVVATFSPLSFLSFFESFPDPSSVSVMVSTRVNPIGAKTLGEWTRERQRANGQLYIIFLPFLSFSLFWSSKVYFFLVIFFSPSFILFQPYSTLWFCGKFWTQVKQIRIGREKRKKKTYNFENTDERKKKEEWRRHKKTERKKTFWTMNST